MPVLLHFGHRSSSFHSSTISDCSDVLRNSLFSLQSAVGSVCSVPDNDQIKAARAPVRGIGRVSHALAPTGRGPISPRIPDSPAGFLKSWEGGGCGNLRLTDQAQHCV
jgi:hypothetical protein